MSLTLSGSGTIGGLVNVAEYVAYRAVLRNLILNPVADPVWPVEPQPVWEAK